MADNVDSGTVFGDATIAEDAAPGVSTGRPPRLAYTLLISGLMAFSMGQTVLFAVLGPIAREIGLRETHVGLIITAAALAVMVSAPFWGRRADSWGRKPVFVFCLVGYALTTFLFAGILQVGLIGFLLPAVAIASLTLARVLYGLVASGIQPAASAYVADVTTEETRSAGMASLGAAFGIGSILGPALGAALAGFGLVVPIVSAALLALVLALVAWRFLPEPARQAAEEKPKLKLTDKRIAPIVVLTLFSFISFAIIQQTTAFYVQDRFGLTPRETATVVGLFASGMAFAMLLSQVVIVQVFKPSPGTLIRFGLLICAAGAGAVMAAPDQTLMMGAFGVFGLGFGLLFPGVNSAGSMRVGVDEQGAALGLVSAAMAGAFVVGPLLGTWLYEQSNWWPLALVAALSMGCCLAAMFMQLNHKAEG